MSLHARRRALRDVGENQLVARFQQLASAALTPQVVLGPGDDAAALRGPAGRLLLLTCDMMVEGTHFRRDWASPYQIGWKAMAQNLSDIAAMGGEPRGAVASLAAPGDLPEAVVEGIAQGLVAAASRYGAALVGGDLVGSPGPLVVDVALTGEVEEELMLRRRGARLGDVILVTGTLGASDAGLTALQQGLAHDGSAEVARALKAHHEPEPRLAEARAIANTRLATAMMDLSDGLAQDLPRLCAASGVGARIDVPRIPVAAVAAALAPRLGKGALAMAITGGEDYELLLTCPPDAVPAISSAVAASSAGRVTVIGAIMAGPGVSFVDAQGRELSPGRGFDHFASGPQP